MRSSNEIVKKEQKGYISVCVCVCAMARKKREEEKKRRATILLELALFIIRLFHPLCLSLFHSHRRFPRLPLDFTLSLGL